MNKTFDVSLHGMSRVEIIEQVAHLCRYCPGAVYMDGQQGSSPVNFLRDLANLLRDELDLALLTGSQLDIGAICKDLLIQWFVYRPVDSGESDIQALHHFLDVATQSGGQALIIVERTAYLSNEALDFLLALMARHARLTVLFAGVTDSRVLLSGAAHFEVPINCIELPDDLPLSAGIVREMSEPAYEPVVNDGVQTGLGQTADLFREQQSGESLRATRALDEEDWLSDIDLGEDVSDRRVRGSGIDSAAMTGTRHRPARSLGDSGYPGAGLSSTILAAATGMRERIVVSGRHKGVLLPAAIIVAFVFLLLLVLQSKEQPGQPVQVVAAPEQPAAPTTTVPPTSTPALQDGGPAAAYAPPPPVIGAPVRTPAPVDSAPVDLAEAGQGSEAAARPVLPAGVDRPGRDKSAKTPAQASPRDGERRREARPAAQWANPEHFTIQVASAHGKDSIEALAARLPSSHPHLIHKTARDGRAWYVLVYGSFSSRAAADKAKTALLVDLKTDSSPWVRKQGEVLGR